MALTKCNVPSNVIGSLATRAEERGLTTQAFKDKFDEMPEGIKQYINEVLTEEIDAYIADYLAYKADNVSQRLAKTRELNLTGVETVTGLRKKPKRITVFAAVNNTQKVCIGTYVVNDNAHATIAMSVSGTYYNFNNVIIRIYDTANDFTSAKIQNVTDSQFEINWEHTGAGATGTLTYQIVIDY